MADNIVNSPDALTEDQCEQAGDFAGGIGSLKNLEEKPSCEADAAEVNRVRKDFLQREGGRRAKVVNACGFGFTRRADAYAMREENRGIVRQSYSTIGAQYGYDRFDTLIPNDAVRACVRSATSPMGATIEQQTAAGKLSSEPLATLWALCEAELGLPAGDPWPLPDVKLMKKADQPSKEKQ